ncbi:uncharacterized protein LOC128217118 [Mya arenaria]|uniref:uncharacterized protein LOC128213347 n=1 Tax=Mya arenaria TaxID=6604 RepID=UPI0022E72654|nr:uncharacterized protein LOC128213347 [Mya arenaria]XP_052779974.1 uncharacterized protein LOC128217118 [Mya arenaria]
MADERVCKQFMKACKLSGSEDATTMTRMCSRNIRRFFWDDVADLEGVDMRHCEEKVFKNLMNKKHQHIRVDPAHVDAYITNLAHEITKIKRGDTKLPRDDPRVTVTKELLENIVRNTKVMLTGTIEKPNDGRDPVQGKGGKPGAKLHEKAEPNRTMENMNYRFRRPDLPKGMKHVFDLRHGKPIVIAKRDYGNLS